MKKLRLQIRICIRGVLILFLLFVFGCGNQTGERVPMNATFINDVVAAVVNKYGADTEVRARTGVMQVSERWQKSDGTREDFREFCLRNFIADPEELNATFNRFEHIFEQINGVFTELQRELNWTTDVNTGPMLAVDRIIPNLNPAAHLEEDLYRSKIAFVVLLNFPRHTLEQMTNDGDNWSRQQWAEVRLAGQFSERVPSEISQQIHEASVQGDNYINNYNIYMGNLRDEDGKALFPDDLVLISHWGLRDELKSQYNVHDGLPRQRIIYDIMLRIIRQEIPESVIDNPEAVWAVKSNSVSGQNVSDAPEPDRRYEMLLKAFHAQKAADKYYVEDRTFIERSFNRYREIPESRVRGIFTRLLASDVVKKTARVIQNRLGRHLEPFDIWYNGFRTTNAYPEDQLDSIVQSRYQTVEQFEQGIPDILHELGFEKNTAHFLRSKIEVDPARGAGHAMGAGRRSDHVHLRTRVPESGMNYKGFNIAVHELGHNVEQVFSLNRIDHTLLAGVPNTAFTEAFAFVFQARDLALLGLESLHQKENHDKVLNQLWSLYEIAGVSLVDIDVWHWMYDHPEATPVELKNATIEIAQSIWNTYYAPVFGEEDSPILAIYSHMIDYPLYLSNYPLGQIIQFQIENYIREKNLGQEMERMCTIGSVTPDYWMQQAVGSPISVDPLLDSANNALTDIE